MATITRNEFVAAYQVARMREQSRLTDARARQILADEHGMNRSSANDYLDAYRHMRAGEVFKRTINAAAASYYLDQIRADFGHAGATLALQSLERHIRYFEPFRGAQCVSLRRVVEDFRPSITQPDEDKLLVLKARLDAAVEASMRLSTEARQKKLPAPGHKPSKTTVTTVVYVRNPAVIAEVLLRACGICEGCGNPAPFARKTDKSPYLEIHHKRRLADGGDDTVENAEALCPNCHRERHFGKLGS